VHVMFMIMLNVSMMLFMLTSMMMSMVRAKVMSKSRILRSCLTMIIMLVFLWWRMKFWVQLSIKLKQLTSLVWSKWSPKLWIKMIDCYLLISLLIKRVRRFNWSCKSKLLF